MWFFPNQNIPVQAIFAVSGTGFQFIQISAAGKVRKKRENKNDRYEKQHKWRLREKWTRDLSRLVFPTVRYKEQHPMKCCEPSTTGPVSCSSCFPVLCRLQSHLFPSKVQQVCQANEGHRNTQMMSSYKGGQTLISLTSSKFQFFQPSRRSILGAVALNLYVI